MDTTTYYEKAALPNETLRPYFDMNPAKAAQFSSETVCAMQQCNDWNAIVNCVMSGFDRTRLFTPDELADLSDILNREQAQSVEQATFRRGSNEVLKHMNPFRVRTTMGSDKIQYGQQDEALSGHYIGFLGTDPRCILTLLNLEKALFIKTSRKINDGIETYMYEVLNYNVQKPPQQLSTGQEQDFQGRGNVRGRGNGRGNGNGRGRGNGQGRGNGRGRGQGQPQSQHGSSTTYIKSEDAKNEVASPFKPFSSTLVFESSDAAQTPPGSPSESATSETTQVEELNEWHNAK